MAQPPILSTDAFEIQFAVNHLAHAMTIQTLLPTLLATASQPDSDVRVITLSSQGYRFHPRPGILFTELSSHSPISRWFLGPRIRYGQSKLANILYAAELARRYPQLTSVSVHPGVVMTYLITNASFANRWMIYVGCWVAGIPILSPSEGSFNSSWAAAGASKDELRSSGSGSGKGSSGGNGGFYMPVGKAATESLDECARDEALAGRLWEWTEGVLGKI
jgi:NAD(P)-dependent dehydrogenase (short-subunit alcohol dehydrogenase family)